MCEAITGFVESLFVLATIIMIIAITLIFWVFLRD